MRQSSICRNSRAVHSRSRGNLRFYNNEIYSRACGNGVGELLIRNGMGARRKRRVRSAACGKLRHIAHAGGNACCHGMRAFGGRHAGLFYGGIPLILLQGQGEGGVHVRNQSACGRTFGNIRIFRNKGINAAFQHAFAQRQFERTSAHFRYSGHDDFPHGGVTFQNRARSGAAGVLRRRARAGRYARPGGVPHGRPRGKVGHYGGHDIGRGQGARRNHGGGHGGGQFAAVPRRAVFFLPHDDRQYSAGNGIRGRDADGRAVCYRRSAARVRRDNGYPAFARHF